MPTTLRSLLVAPEPTSRNDSGFAATSALILLGIFVALVLAAGYLGRMMAG